MTEQIRNKLSALMDDELDSTDCPDDINDKTVTETWRRYHIISDIMHLRTPIHSHSHLSTQISQAIQDEPTILAPDRSYQSNNILRPLAGVAVAASVAAVAILGIQNYQENENPLDAQTIQIELVSSTAAPLEYGVPVEPRATSPEAAATARPVQLQIQTDSRISRYILNHSEYQSNMGVQGMTPHIRLVATESDDNE